jgi:DNA repair proteins
MELLTKDIENTILKLYSQERVDDPFASSSWTDSPRKATARATASITGDWNAAGTDTAGIVEALTALYLNARNRLRRDDPEIYTGTLDRAVVETREILKRGLLLNAAGIILYHNHPSGDPSPSRCDSRKLGEGARR